MIKRGEVMREVPEKGHVDGREGDGQCDRMRRKGSDTRAILR